MKPSPRWRHETQDTLAEANATAEEVISAVSTTRAFDAAAGEVRRYKDGLTKYIGTVWLIIVLVLVLLFWGVFAVRRSHPRFKFASTLRALPVQ